MHFSDLPGTKVLTQSADESVLTKALQKILGERGRFWSYDVVQASPSSGRVLFVDVSDIGDAQPMPVQKTANEMASELLQFSAAEARYPSEPMQAGAEKGWEVRVGQVKGHTVAVVFALYCPKGESASSGLAHYV